MPKSGLVVAGGPAAPSAAPTTRKATALLPMANNGR
jgi:hypothetical protein